MREAVSGSLAANRRGIWQRRRKELDDMCAWKELPPRDERTLGTPSLRLRVEALACASGITLRCTGELDLATIDRLEALLTRAIGSGVPSVDVDLRGVEFLDSCTLNALLAAHQKLNQAGRTLRVWARPAAIRLFGMAGLDRILDIGAVCPMPAHPTPAG
jgi:anti-sigma B factor antagonist